MSDKKEFYAEIFGLGSCVKTEAAGRNPGIALIRYAPQKNGHPLRMSVFAMLPYSRLIPYTLRYFSIRRAVTTYMTPASARAITPCQTSTGMMPMEAGTSCSSLLIP